VGDLGLGSTSSAGLVDRMPDDLGQPVTVTDASQALRNLRVLDTAVGRHRPTCSQPRASPLLVDASSPNDAVAQVTQANWWRHDGITNHAAVDVTPPTFRVVTAALITAVDERNPLSTSRLVHANYLETRRIASREHSRTSCGLRKPEQASDLQKHPRGSLIQYYPRMRGQCWQRRA